jgi:DNA adenine methylase
MSSPSASARGPIEASSGRPVLKWAGGKTQLLPQLEGLAPKTFGKYIEPFIGGGALFFHLAPDTAVIGDTNSELINLYHCLSTDAAEVSKAVREMPISSEDFYAIRALDWKSLGPVRAAARTIYLNRLCFNGLYRVNRKGEFNVPFGNYKKPSFPSVESLATAGEVLSRATIVDADFEFLLKKHAAAGDFVFLDPPYIPVGKYSDFKRYNAKQFGEEDQEKLAVEVKRLVDLGCYVLLTNSNHPMVHSLYKDFDIQILETRRNINSRGDGRRGEDVIVVADGLMK